MWVKQLGEGKFGGKEHEFYFGHVEFETVNSHSSEDIKQATRYTNLELRRVVEAGEINWRPINIQENIQSLPPIRPKKEDIQSHKTSRDHPGSEGKM